MPMTTDTRTGQEESNVRLNSLPDSSSPTWITKIIMWKSRENYAKIIPKIYVFLFYFFE